MTPPTKPSVRPIPLGGKTDEDKKNFLLANTDAVFTTIPNDKIDDVSLKKFLAMFKNFTGYDASMEKVEKNIIKTRLMAFIQSGAEPEYHLKFAPKAVPVPYPVTAPAPAPAPSSEPEQESSFTAAATTAVTATAAALASPSGFADSATFSPSPVTAATSVAASPLKAHSLSPVYDKAARKQKKKDEKIRRKEEKRLRKLEKEAKRTAKKAAKKGEAERGTKRRAHTVSVMNEILSRSYFRTRHTSSVTTAIIIIPYPNPFRDSLRSSQLLLKLPLPLPKTLQSPPTSPTRLSSTATRRSPM